MYMAVYCVVFYANLICFNYFVISILGVVVAVVVFISMPVITFYSFLFLFLFFFCFRFFFFTNISTVFAILLACLLVCLSFLKFSLFLLPLFTSYIEVLLLCIFLYTLAVPLLGFCNFT